MLVAAACNHRSELCVSFHKHRWRHLLAMQRRKGLSVVEPELEAENKWVDHVQEVANKTLFPQANSWYMGANIPGKPRLFMPYIGGVGAYREICEEIVANNYRGFKFEKSKQAIAAE